MQRVARLVDPERSAPAFFVWWHARQIAYVARILFQPGFVERQSRFYWTK